MGAGGGGGLLLLWEERGDLIHSEFIICSDYCNKRMTSHHLERISQRGGEKDKRE